jgi:hypothetical protein
MVWIDLWWTGFVLVDNTDWVMNINVMSNWQRPWWLLTMNTIPSGWTYDISDWTNTWTFNWNDTSWTVLSTINATLWDTNIQLIWWFETNNYLWIEETFRFVSLYTRTLDVSNTTATTTKIKLISWESTTGWLNTEHSNYLWDINLNYTSDVKNIWNLMEINYTYETPIWNVTPRGIWQRFRGVPDWLSNTHTFMAIWLTDTDRIEIVTA